MKHEENENPLNEVKRQAELQGMRILLSELITACRRVGSPHVTLKALEKRLEDLI